MVGLEGSLRASHLVRETRHSQLKSGACAAFGMLLLRSQKDCFHPNLGREPINAPGGRLARVRYAPDSRRIVA
jgi:hypothetical protein